MVHSHQMKNRHETTIPSVFLRPWGVYYIRRPPDRQTGQPSRPRDKDEAFRLVAAKNENEELPPSVCIARVYWRRATHGSPPGHGSTSWTKCSSSKQDETQHRWQTAIKDKAFDSIRHLVDSGNPAEHFLRVLETGKVSTNIYLRRIHNFALDMNWLPWPVLPKKRWPASQVQGKARHHLGGTSGHRCPRIESRTQGVLQTRVAFGRVANRPCVS